MEYVKVVSNEHSYTSHPHHAEYGCVNFQLGGIPGNGYVCEVIRYVLVNNNQPGASLNYNGQHYLVGTRGYVSSTQEAYDAQFQQEELIQIDQQPILNEQKMKVKCINQGVYRSISVGGEYHAEINLADGMYKILINGAVRRYATKYFEVIEEEIIPAVEDIDEAGVAEEIEPVIYIEFEDGNQIKILINEVVVTRMTWSRVANNCGVHGIDGINNLYDATDENDELFEKCISAIIDEYNQKELAAAIVFSTNNRYEEIWSILDAMMDWKSKEMFNPNSDLYIKMWTKYIDVEEPSDDDDIDDDDIDDDF